MDQSIVIAILVATIAAGTPLIFVGLGELITEKSGLLNLGAEGVMAVSAILGFIATYHSGSPVLGILAAGMTGALVVLIFAFLSIHLLANQVAASLALAIFGAGLSSFIGKPYESSTLEAIPAFAIPVLSQIPFIGAVLFTQQWIVYLSWLMFALILWFLRYSKHGLILRAIGENPKAAHNLGYSVVGYRYCATMFGGFMSGLGGGFLSIFYTPLWVEGMVAGRGWIGLALVVFASWRPWRVLVGAYAFGGVLIVQLFVQGSGLRLNVPAQLLTALPYIATIVILVLISRNELAIRLHAPHSLGKPFFAKS